ncbi:YHS domain family protein [Leptospira ryugenii]|uniref:YHS domain family protein n=1 Tax=Leptospira ryugenii TaxID=1917863 RepID=A0A2P2E596_9LEPT|nr:YHS domain-containing (seleno)protein [Leptospira ryugenii]GBF52040.1 YHS domain family protein [Leptospira ryugenii]
MPKVNFKQSLVLFFLVLSASLSSEPINQSFFRKVAVEGTDVVAYFTEKKAIPGKREFSYEWKGAKWYFSSQKHLDLFKKSPETYTPAYGGFCAFAMSEGERYGISPEAWHIENGKLYLNYDKEVHEEWLQKRAELIKKADKAWQVESKK